MVVLKEEDGLYPQPEMREEGFLQVSRTPPHKLYWAEYGNPKGEPVLFIHGGPGSGCKPSYARFFDPEHYRIILFDQRGAGKSEPNASLEDNTTWHSIGDILKLRADRGIEGKMHLFGGSWGSTLSLAYAINHPDTVASMALRGIFLCRKEDLEYFYQGDAGGGSWGIGAMNPVEWRKYVDFIPEDERGDMIAAYHRRLTGSDEEVKLEAARRWSVWEAAMSKFYPDPDLEEQYADARFALRFARIECHYFINGIFLGENGSREQNYIIENVAAIADIPTEIVQARMDQVCPYNQAWDLVQAWNAAQPKESRRPTLHTIDFAGHNMMEPGVKEKLVEVTDRFRLLGRGQELGG